MTLDSLRSASSDNALSVPPPKRRWLFRVCLPLMIFLFSGALFAFAARDALVPAREVEVIRVALREEVVTQKTQAKKQGKAGKAKVTVQAPGWLEPDPFAIYVSALADGVVKQVLVLEGDVVKKGQVLARMITDDAELTVNQAKAELAMKKAQLIAARTDWQEPVLLNRQIAVNEAACLETKAALNQLAAMVTEQQAKQKELAATYASVKDLSSQAISPLEIETARHKLSAQEALVASTIARQPVLEAQLRRQEAELAAARDELRLRVVDKRRVAEAEALVAAAQVRLDEAELRLSRMTIKSPYDGVVMRRLVSTGAKVMLGMDSPHSAHIVHLYDPDKLQVRVDVPLSEAAKVGVGQKAAVIVDVLPDETFEGELTRFVHQADISKNTVEVKVAVKNPSQILKPDMLARVKFFATEKTPENKDLNFNASEVAVYVPDTVIRSEGEMAYVWCLEAKTNRLLKRTVELGAERNEASLNWRHVIDGISPGDVLVNNPADDLKEGQRVKPKEVEA